MYELSDGDIAFVVVLVEAVHLMLQYYSNRAMEEANISQPLVYAQIV